MLKVWLEAKNRSKLILRSRDHNTELRLRDQHITIVLQLFFFLDMIYIKHIVILIA